MRMRAVGFVLAALGGVCFGAWRLGEAASGWIERETLSQARAELARAGETWATVSADGLLLTLGGAAPDEARRLAAESALRGVVDPRRLRDATSLAAAVPALAPVYGLELLRAEDEVSAVGLAPKGAAEALAAALARARLSLVGGDMLEEIDRPAPPDWDVALRFALRALADLPQAKVSVGPGSVSISALGADAETAAATADRLRAAAPAELALVLDIAAPRPAIAPFRFAFALDPEGASRLDACDVETGAEAARLAAAAGAPVEACRIGLGAPSPDWAAAAEAGVAAVRDLGGGRFALDDLAATLEAPTNAEAAADPAKAEAAAARLAAALPRGFALRFDAPAAPAATEAPRFEATLSMEGAAHLAGPLRDAASEAAVTNYAEALFGDGRAAAEIRIDPNLPAGWNARVLAGIEALALMREGTLDVTPDLVSLEGTAVEADGETRAAALLAERATGPAALSIGFDAAAAEAEAAARAMEADPAGACLAGVRSILAEAGIGFQPGSAKLSDEGLAAVAAIGAALVNCPPLDLEIAGHTDASGSAAANQALSEDRALAVKFALEAIGLPQMRFIARGYGPERPIADNDTDEGRSRNRRIEFALLGRAEPAPAPAQEAAPGAAPVPAPAIPETRFGPQ